MEDPDVRETWTTPRLEVLPLSATANSPTPSMNGDGALDYS
ncbi:hypothetical protein [Nocardioides sp.]